MKDDLLHVALVDQGLALAFERASVPEQRLIVVGTARKQGGIRAERDAADHVADLLDRADAPGGADVPEVDAMTEISRSQEFAISAEGE